MSDSCSTGDRCGYDHIFIAAYIMPFCEGRLIRGINAP